VFLSRDRFLKFSILLLKKMDFLLEDPLKAMRQAMRY